jgi:hypothetical protein
VVLERKKNQKFIQKKIVYTYTPFDIVLVCRFRSDWTEDLLDFYKKFEKKNLKEVCFLAFYIIPFSLDQPIH